jgi:hypothetical protein
MNRGAVTNPANNRAFNAFTKGAHDNLRCSTPDDLAAQLAAKYKGATKTEVLGLLNANTKFWKKGEDGVIRRIPRCNLTKAATRGSLVSA